MHFGIDMHSNMAILTSCFDIDVLDVIWHMDKDFVFFTWLIIPPF